MLSAGNDIVSLNAINVTRAKQPNFYSKILTPTETALHQQPCFANIPFEIFVWLLWSIKESAFKYLQRINAAVLFTPVKFEVGEIHVPEEFTIDEFSGRGLTGNGCGFDLLLPITSILTFEDKALYSNSLICKEFVFTIVNGDTDFNYVNWGIKEIESSDTEAQSLEVRKFLIDNFPDTNIIIGKNQQGIPVLLKDKIELSVPISLSHHEYYVGYSFQLPV